ncbi:hypothetical protein NDU88_008044 [Pleurodeles waltl]|uniref:Uncharacterized protein n=1 Tax=Pleurodeles waltl TaxID=8319 RepID=A0AAV7QQR2_PLEWA|nr:hypothetical protein NDU88_008044 [Pleurodeles waltl]
MRSGYAPQDWRECRLAGGERAVKDRAARAVGWALYASEAPSGDNLCAAFLPEVELPCLGEEQVEALEAPLDLEEIKASIRELASGKTPGPDGLPVDFYKAFKLQLAPRLLRVYEGLGPYWREVIDNLSNNTARRIPFTWESNILGLFPRSKRHTAEVHFTDLGLIVARRLVTHRWKSPDPPPVQAWRRSLEVWVGAEKAALRMEEALGLGQIPLSISWEEMMIRLRGMGAVPDEGGLD